MLAVERIPNFILSFCISRSRLNKIFIIYINYNKLLLLVFLSALLLSLFKQYRLKKYIYVFFCIDKYQRN